MDEEQYKKELADQGVDLPELKEEKKEEPAKEPIKESPKEEAKVDDKKEAEVEPTKPLTEEPKVERKRSIYDEYKEKKSELKSEKELREQVERERDELARKLQEATDAKGTKNADESAEDAIAYAAKIGADPDLVKRIIADAQKGFKSAPDESIKKDLEEFKAWKAQNSASIEKQMFEQEFQKVTPTLKELFPTASAEEITSLKSELDKLSHTKEYHDKDLDYVAFKNKEKLSAFISPKKRGIEGKSKKDIQEESFDFDPNADYSKLSPAEKVKWEEGYNKLGKTEGLVRDANGKKILI